MEIKLIIFDMGGVIIDFKEEQYISYISKKHGIPYDKLYAVMVPMIIKMEEGRFTEKQMTQVLSRRFALGEKELEWKRAFVKIARLNKNVFNLIEELSKSYDVVVLSNISRSRYEEAKKKFLDNLHVEKIYASCTIGVRKPDRRAYEYVLSKSGVKAGETLFIDNLRENIAGARKVSIDSILFKNYKQLVKALEKRKML